jgi:hypothetical protein
MREKLLNFVISWTFVMHNSVFNSAQFFFTVYQRIRIDLMRIRSGSYFFIIAGLDPDLLYKFKRNVLGYFLIFVGKFLTSSGCCYL